MMEHYEETIIKQHNNKNSLQSINSVEINTTATVMSLQESVTGVTDFEEDLLQNAALEAVDGSVELPKTTQNVKQLNITLSPANVEEAATTTTTVAINNQTDVDNVKDEYDSVEGVDQHITKKNEPDAPDLNDGNSNDSNMSNLSEMSDLSGRDWKPICQRPLRWVHKQMQNGVDPRALLAKMLPSVEPELTAEISKSVLWRILATILSEPPRREKLPNVNTLEDVVSLIKSSKNIIVLTGAGVSVSCGIPDFRSSDGIYARLAKEYPGLPDPQSMFDINYFKRDPRPFFKFAREIFPGQFRPSPCHRFIKLLESKQRLLRNYTQNIDTLEKLAGIKNVIECHGSFSTASCTRCKYKCSAEDIRAEIFAQRIPLCPRCMPNATHSIHVNDPVSTPCFLKRMVEHGIMKPNIVFFGEGLPEEFHNVMTHDKDKCDLLIVIGSSLKVRPVALIPSSLPPNVPQILINREQLTHLEFDVQLLGDSDIIVNQLCHRLGEDFADICYDEDVLTESKILKRVDGLLPLSRSSISSSDITDDSNEDNMTSEDVESEEIEHEEEEEVEQLDTDSVKSSASTDLALRSAGIYSDSGFESSTSSGNNLVENLATQNSQDEAIEFSAVVVNEDKEIKTEKENCENVPKQEEEAKEPMVNIIENDAAQAGVAVAVSARKTVVKRHNKETRRNTADCLIEGTYFCNEKKSAYVFPGAQVHWYASSSEESEEDDSYNGKHHHRCHSSQAKEEIRVADEKVAKKIHSHKTNKLLQRYPLHTLSAAMAAAAPKTKIKKEKRRSTNTEQSDTSSTASSSTSEQASCSSPPIKKRRDSEELITENASSANTSTTTELSFNKSVVSEQQLSI